MIAIWWGCGPKCIFSGLGANFKFMLADIGRSEFSNRAKAHVLIQFNVILPLRLVSRGVYSTRLKLIFEATLLQITSYISRLLSTIAFFFFLLSSSSFFVPSLLPMEPRFLVAALIHQAWEGNQFCLTAFHADSKSTCNQEPKMVILNDGTGSHLLHVCC